MADNAEANLQAVPVLWLYGADAVGKSTDLRRRQIEATATGVALDDDVLRELQDYGERSARFAALLDRDDIADVTLDTDDATPAALARLAIAAVADWPGQPRASSQDVTWVTADT